MDEQKAVTLIKKFKAQRKSVKIISIVLIIAILIFIPIPLIYRVIISIVLLLIMKFLLDKIESNVGSIFYSECDPELYYAVCKGIKPKADLTNEQIVVAQFMGDYQKAIELLTKLKKVKTPNSIKAYLCQRLATQAFEGGDFELCENSCNESISLINSLKSKNDNMQAVEDRCNFYLSFMNCDYDNALDYLNKCMSIKKQENSYKIIMNYYLGLTYYYSNNFNSAREQFESVISSAPKFYVAKCSDEYIKAIDNNEIKTIQSTTYNTNFQATENSAKLKISKFMVIVAIILLVVAVISICQLFNLGNGELPDIISENEEVEVVDYSLVDIDENYTICIYQTNDNQVGVTYLKNLDDEKYKYTISYLGTMEMYEFDDCDYYIYASGDCSKVYFDITDDQSKTVDYQLTKEFSYNGKTYYFCYTLDDVKYHFGNACGINLN